MKGFPLFSNFEDFVREEFDSRKGNPLKVSQFNVWVRMMSAVGDGLIMYSNPEHKLFKAAGDTNVNTIYGGQSTSGILGVDWKGVPVNAGTSDVPLKPSPIVTSISIDEGTGNISRKASISMTAFTKDQADLMAEYFLEPGFTVFFEFGWNNSDAMTGLIDVSSRSVESIASKIADMQNFNSLIDRRRKSKGKYDNYLGYITGGNVSVSGENWEISVELTGFNEIPYYLMNRDMIGKNQDAIKPAEVYGDVEDEEDDVIRRFKIMFNDLPAKRRTRNVKLLESLVSVNDLINFDEKVIDKINNRAGQRVIVPGTEGVEREEQTQSARQVYALNHLPTGVWEIPNDTKIVDSERFISMRLAMKILELNADAIRLANGKRVKLNVDIEDTVIKAFKHIYSTDKSKLLIPNSQTPAFSLGTALREGDITLKAIAKKENNLNNSFGNYKFPQDQPLYEDVNHTYYEPSFAETVGIEDISTREPIGALTGKVGDILKNAHEWGYLKHLYINFEFFKRTIDTQTFTLSDILKALLNGLSDAVSSYWDFQIFEREAEGGNMTLQIVDVEFTTKTDDENIYELPLLGEQCIFAANSFNMDIPGAMANKIIGERLGNAIQSTLNSTGLFTKKRDNVLIQLEEASRLNDTNVIRSLTDMIPPQVFSESPRTEETVMLRGETETEDETEELTIEGFFGNTGVYPKPQWTVDTIDFSISGTRVLDDYIIYGTYNDTQLFDGIYNRNNERMVKNDAGNHSNEYSTLLPLKFSFTVHGITGIRRGDKFKVLGLPKIFTDNAFFQITSIKQSVSGNGWQTEVEGALRRAL